MTVLRKTLFLFLWFGLTVAAHAATWITIDVPGATWTYALGINQAGDIVGTYVSEGQQHGFLLRGNTYTTVDPPGAISSQPVGINDSGHISGWYQTSDQRSHGFFFDGQTYTRLDAPGADNTAAQGLNNAGEVVGYSDLKKAFKWSNGTFTTINVPGSKFTAAYGINNRGHIVGIYGHGDRSSFLESPNGNFRTLLIRRGPGSANSVNDSRVVVGGYVKGGLVYGFKLIVSTKRLRRLQFPGSGGTSCFGINNGGQIVGLYVDGARKQHGFLRNP